MDVKQSIANIGEWAKKHPILAGGIVLVLVLLAWWVSKQGGGGGSSNAMPEAEASEAPALGSLGPSGGSLLDSVNNATGGITQTPPVYDEPHFDALPSIPDMGSSGMFDPGSVQDAVYAAPSVSPVSEAIAEIVTPGSKAQSAVTNLATAKIDRKKSETASISKTAKSGAKNKITRVTTPAKSAVTPGMPVITRPSAPVLMPGFTGYLAGIYYYNGIPAGSVGGASATIPGIGVIATPTKTGGGRTGR